MCEHGRVHVYIRLRHQIHAPERIIPRFGPSLLRKRFRSAFSKVRAALTVTTLEDIAALSSAPTFKGNERCQQPSTARTM